MKDDKMLVKIEFINNTSKLDQIPCFIVCVEDVVDKLGLGAYPEELLFMIGGVVFNSQYLYFYCVFVFYS